MSLVLSLLQRQGLIPTEGYSAVSKKVICHSQDISFFPPGMGKLTILGEFASSLSITASCRISNVPLLDVVSNAGLWAVASSVPTKVL